MRTITFWLLLILIFTIPWEAIIIFPGLGTLTRAIGLLAAALWMLTVLTTGGFRKLRPFHLAVCLFFFWNLVSAFWSVNIDDTVVGLQSYAQLLAMSLIIWDLCTTPRAIKMGLQAYVLGAYVSIASVVYNYLTSTPISGMRYAASGFNPNDLALILSLGMPIAWYLAVSDNHDKRTAFLGLANYGYIITALFAIELTASRGGLISTIPTFLFIVSSFDRFGRFRKVLILILLIGSLFALQSFVPQASVDRFSTTATSISQGSLGGRGAIWRGGIDVFLQHPIVGVGSGGFRYATELGKAPHNTFLSVLVDLGVIGFSLLAAILAITISNALHQPKQESRLWLTVLMILVLGAMVHNAEGKKVVWLFLTMVTASANLPNHHAVSRRHSGLATISTGSLEGGIDEGNKAIPLAS